ncbi:MAG TPA: PBP1A family penicillin-binding protein [Myxococcota bacterium]|nr:PBP1A family penicillin-binding protein [Myxococcota bacterium]
MLPPPDAWLRNPKARLRVLVAVLLGVLMLVGVLAAGAVSRLEERVEARFRGQLFALPSRVYARPVSLHTGLDLERIRLRARLERMGYVKAVGAHPELRAGQYAWRPGELDIFRRASNLPSHPSPERLIRLRLDGSRISAVRDAADDLLPSEELEPEIIAQFHGAERADRRLVALADVPPILVEAIIAIEDQSFYEHHGIQPWRIAGAFVANLRAGKLVQGGSTLTQQLVKNFYLTRERTLGRKLTEVAMALILERNHTKQEILEAYLNEVYMGQRGSVAIHGMGEAANHYFGKPVSDLNLPEAALLAGLIKGPNLYSPYRSPDAARKRRDLVLTALREQDKITRDAYESALVADLGVRDVVADENLAPYYVEELSEELTDRYGDEILQSAGMSIYSTLDAELQRAANEAVTRQLARLEKGYPALRRKESPLQAAVVALKPQTGEILALVGGRDYGKSQFNRAVQAHRQPGSVFKPIVLLTAVGRAAGPPAFTLVSKLEDEPLTYAQPSGIWQPVNYDGEYRGTVTVRQAIEQSLNVPVARLGLAIGPERVVATARQLGIESPLQPVPSVALGAFEVTMLEAARVYAVFASGGLRPELRSYTQVVQADGRVLEQRTLDAPRVFDPADVYLVTSALEGVVDRGTGAPLRALGFRGDIAGKTGTSSDYRDAWFIGYTPEIVIAVWVGFDDGASVKVTGATAALPIFADVLEVARGKGEAEEFTVPTGVELVDVDRDSGLRAGFGCGGDPEVFLRGTAPAQGCGIFDFAKRSEPPPDQRAGAEPPKRNVFQRLFGWIGR